MAELSFEELLRGLTTEPVQAGGRISAAQLAEAEAKAAARAASVAANQVDRTPGVRAAESYLAKAKEAAKGTKLYRGGAKGLLKKGLKGGGVVSGGLLLNELLQGATEFGVNYYNPERPRFIPPEVHKQIMDRIGNVDIGRDTLLQRDLTGEPDVPGIRINPRSIQFPALKGSIPSSQPAAPRGATRRPVNLNAIDDPSIPIERGTGVIRNERTGRVFGVDARDTVNRQFEDVDITPRVTLPPTGFSDIDAAMPGLVRAAIEQGRQRRTETAAAATAKESRDFVNAVLLEQLKQEAPTTKVLEPALPGQPPTVVTSTPGGGATAQAALPPGQDLQTIDSKTREMAVQKPHGLTQINALRANYGLSPITE